MKNLDKNWVKLTALIIGALLVIILLDTVKQVAFRRIDVEKSKLETKKDNSKTEERVEYDDYFENDPDDEFVLQDDIEAFEELQELVKTHDKKDTLNSIDTKEFTITDATENSVALLPDKGGNIKVVELKHNCINIHYNKGLDKPYLKIFVNGMSGAIMVSAYIPVGYAKD